MANGEIEEMEEIITSHRPSLPKSLSPLVSKRDRRDGREIHQPPPFPAYRQAGISQSLSPFHLSVSRKDKD